MDKVMKGFLIFYMAAALASCTSCAGFSSIDIGSVDAEFQSHVDKYNKFKEDAGKGKTRSDVTILFHSLPSPTIGVCYWMANGDREVYIDPRFWYGPYTTDLDRELLIFHELGHCDLDRDHVDPSSIMEKYHIGDYLYSLNTDYYAKELFDESIRKDLEVDAMIKPGHIHSGCGGIVKEKGN